MTPNPDRIMPFGDHLEELRRRVVFTLAGIVLLFVVALIFGRVLLEVIAAPLISELRAAGQSPALLATSPLEAFGSYVKISTVAALLASMPWTLYQLWLFVSPGLHKAERRFVYFLLPMSGVLTAGGVALLYFVVLPVTLYFLISFGSGLIAESPGTAPLLEGVTLPTVPVLASDPPAPEPGQMWVNSTLDQLRVRVQADQTMGLALVGTGLIAQQYRVSEYVNLVFLLGLAFALASQVPIVLMLLSWVGILSDSDLTPYRKHALLACAVAAALMPAQDPWSMLVMALTLYALFEVGIVLMRFVPARVVAGGG
ncbi:MAG TPA: hypothetical protein DEB06_07345, partial [Phycisphaerales bacterium]|nr:hypothetical protein [Phycisphaerales bacterium]